MNDLDTRFSLFSPDRMNDRFQLLQWPQVGLVWTHHYAFAEPDSFLVFLKPDQTSSWSSWWDETLSPSKARLLWRYGERKAQKGDVAHDLHQTVDILMGQWSRRMHKGRRSDRAYNRLVEELCDLQCYALVSLAEEWCWLLTEVCRPLPNEVCFMIAHRVVHDMYQEAVLEDTFVTEHSWHSSYRSFAQRRYMKHEGEDDIELRAAYEMVNTCILLARMAEGHFGGPNLSAEMCAAVDQHANDVCTILRLRMDESDSEDEE